MKIVIITMILFGLIVTGCTSEKSESSVTSEKATLPVSVKITAEEAKNMMDSSEVLVVDVRTKEEYESGHVPGAILLPLADLQSGDFSLLTDKNETLLLYCRSGNRSGQAAKLLTNEGYTNVYDFGGIIDWSYDVE